MRTKWSLIGTFADKNRSLFLYAFVSGLLYNAFTLLIPISIGRFYEFNFGFSSHRLQLIHSLPLINTPDFTEFLIFFLAIVGIRFILEFLNRYFIGLIAEKFAKDLREKLFAHQLQISAAVYDQKGIGKYLLRYSGDLKSIQNYISLGLLRFMQDVILIGILLIAILYIDLGLGLVLGVSILIFSALLFFINKVLYSISVQRRNKRSQVLSFINTRLRGILSIKAFNKYTPEEKRYLKRSNELYALGRKYQKVTGAIQALIPALTYLMLGALMVFVHHLKNTSKETVDQSALLVLILLIISFLPIFRRILRVNITWKLGAISFEKLIRILSLKAENTLDNNPLNLSGQAISFSGVTFGYPENSQEVFHGISLRIEPLKTTAVIGKSGSGKSTLVQLLLKLYSPVKGKILFGKHPIDQVAEKAIRKNIAVVSRDFPLYGRDVYEAVVYSRKERNKPKVISLLDALQKFESPADRLSLESKIGEMGNRLTGSQIKLLMYCRALLTKKPILIIEEPFGDLNPDTVVGIKTALNRLKGKKTIVILDKNLKDGIDVDACYVLEEQKIVRSF